MRAIGRNKPDNLSHTTLHPVSGITLTAPVPVVAGTEWLTGFDAPVRGADGKYRVPAPTAPSFGTSRGGHCYCLEPAGEPDQERAWIFYNQGEISACEGFGNSRAMTLLTLGSPGAEAGGTLATLFDAFWLYDDARRCEGTFPSGEGSTNKAAAEALKRWGDHPDADPGEVIVPVPWQRGLPSVEIASFHWATTVEDIRQALGYGPEINEFPFLNSWGQLDYPHRTYMPAETLAWLLENEAEYTVLVPR
jgi:hypothetical protein